MTLPHRRIRRAMCALMTLCLAVGMAGCRWIDPVVSAGTPSPRASERAISLEPSPEDTPQPADTPETIPSPTPEATAEPNGAGAYTIAADTSESQKLYYSTEPDENALRVENGARVSIDSGRVEKRKGESSSLENAGAYGLNTAVLVHGNAQLLMINGDISSAASGAGGAFAYDGSLQIQGGSVRTSADYAFGLAAGQGGIRLSEATVSTQGAQSPALIARAGGILSITGGRATTNSASSPALESAGSIDAANATIRANGAEAAAINGGAIRLTDCAVTGRMIEDSGAGASLYPYCVALYRDAGAWGRECSFTMTRGALTALAGDLFYATNTTANIYLEGVSISLPAGRALLRAKGNDGSLGRGRAGSNGADCALIAQDQALAGDIIADELSSVSLTLKGNSSYTGTVNAANTARAAEVTLEYGSTWTLTGNAYLTAFTGRLSGIAANGYTVYVNGVPLTD